MSAVARLFDICGLSAVGPIPAGALEVVHVSYWRKQRSATSWSDLA